MKNGQRTIETSRAAAYLILGGVFLLIYWQRLLLQSMIPFDGNTIRLFYPSWVIGKKMLIDGCYFLWDPYRNMGQPFLADPQCQALYPIRFISVFLNFLDYQRIFVVFHSLLAAVSAFLLGKRLFENDEAALFAALAMGFSGFFLARVTLPAHFATMAWTPGLMLLLYNRRPIFLGLALSLQWMAGFPPFFILTFIILFFSSFVSDTRISALASLTKGYLIMLGLTAVQWIPFSEMLRESSRPLLLSGADAIEYSIHPLELLRQSVVPSVILTFLEPFTDSDQAMISFYFGPVFLLLVILGALRGRGRERIFLWMALLGLIMALGQYNKFYQFIPFITLFRFPGNWILLTTIGFTFVGARGLAGLGKKLRRGALGLVALDFFLYALFINIAWRDTIFFQFPFRLERLESVPQESRILHTPAITDRIHRWKANTTNDWFMIQMSLAPSIGTAYGIKETASYSVLTSKRHRAFVQRLNRSPISSVLFDYAGISKLIVLTREGLDKELPEWRDFRVIENPEFRSIAFMESGNPVHVLKNKPGNVNVRAEGPGRLVLSEAYYPGWRIKIDGKNSPVSIFEEEFPSADLSPGSHEVQFRYRPASFMWGSMVSALTILVLFAGKMVQGRPGLLTGLKRGRICEKKSSWLLKNG